MATIAVARARLALGELEAARDEIHGVLAGEIETGPLEAVLRDLEALLTRK